MNRSSLDCSASKTPSRCPHGWLTGSFERGEALGAFIPIPRSQLEPSAGLPLAGIRVAVKDNIDVAGFVTAAGSAALERNTAASDARVVRLLKQAGAVIAARTRMDEFALTTYGPSMRNPFDERLSVGGSSGGAALAVAAGGFCVALGTDTGGSVRIPAAYCGVVGFKPSFGRVSVDGIVPMAPSLDHVGVLACSAPMASEIFASIAEDARAGTEVDAPLSRLRLGVPDAAYLEAATDDVREAFERAVTLLCLEGAEAVEVALPSVERLMAIHYPIALVEAARYHDATFPDLSRHGTTVRDVLQRARAYSDDDYLVAQAARARLTSEVAALFGTVDVLALPTTPTVAPRRPPQAIRLGTGAEVDAVSGSIWYTALFNDTGMPAISLPCETEGSPPVGFQLAAPYGADEVLLDVAQRMERLLRSGGAAAHRLRGPQREDERGGVAGARE